MELGKKGQVLAGGILAVIVFLQNEIDFSRPAHIAISAVIVFTATVGISGNKSKD